MFIASFDLQSKRTGSVYRAARLAMLRSQLVRHIERTDAAARKVEQVLADLAEANGRDG